MERTSTSASTTRLKAGAKYHELVAKYPTPESRKIVINDDAVCVAELASKYVEFAQEYYGNNKDERYRIRAAINLLIELYCNGRFSPLRSLTILIGIRGG